MVAGWSISELFGLAILLGLCVLVFWLMTKPLFWAVAGLLAWLAAVFACIASIIHFQIIAAVGFAVLAIFIKVATYFLIGLTEK